MPQKRAIGVRNEAKPMTHFGVIKAGSKVEFERPNTEGRMRAWRNGGHCLSEPRGVNGES